MSVFETSDIIVRVKTGNSYETVCDIQSLDCKMTYEVEKRLPASGGWGQSLISGRWMELFFAGKRCAGNPGNDYIAGRAMSAKGAAETLKLTFPDGRILRISGAMCVTQPFGGAGLSALTWRFVSSGGPMISDGGEE